MKIRKLFSALLVILVLVMAVFAARSIMRPEKFKSVYEFRKAANVSNLLAIRSAQAVYKTVYKKYASDIDSLADFVKNGYVEVEKTIGTIPDSISQEQAFKMGLIHKETVKVPAMEKILELDQKNLTPESFKNFTRIPYSDNKKYKIQTGVISNKNYEVPLYRIDVPIDDILINMDRTVTPENSNVFKKVWDKIFFNNLSEETQYKSLYPDLYMGSLTEASTAGSWE
ncbi:MAG: hypothetical protein IKR77_06190 [Bacteroidales bacterium]|nr:hypothetical protein [Bacteroidales bacterium]